MLTNYPPSYINNKTITHFHPRHTLCIITLLINPRQFRGQVLLLPISSLLFMPETQQRVMLCVHWQAPGCQPRAPSTPEALPVDWGSPGNQHTPADL